jgi:regulator of replication initiation timing
MLYLSYKGKEIYQMDILEKLKTLLGKVEDLQDELVNLIDELEELELDEDDLDELDDEDEEDDIKIGLSE